jgi:hypothetical protein
VEQLRIRGDKNVVNESSSRAKKAATKIFELTNK